MPTITARHSISFTGYRVTVIIVNWNGKHHLGDCLDSLRRQTFKDFAIVLVDNGSDDGSIEYVQENYQEVRIIALPENRGFCAPNNIAVAQTRSAYVCLLNNDTELNPECLSAMVRTMNQDPQTGICDAVQIIFDHRDTIYSMGATYTIAGSTESVAAQNKNLTRSREVFIGMAACVLYRRTMLDRIGMFDENFVAGYEDVDLSFRAHLAGYRVKNAAHALCYHKISATHKANSDAFVRRGQRNFHWVFFKNMPGPLLRRYLVHHLGYTLLTAFYFFRIGRGQAWLASKLDVLRSLPRLLEKRRQVQALKRVSNREIDALLTKHWLITPAKRKKFWAGMRQGSNNT